MALKVAMHNWMRPEPIETTISRLASAGYDAIEIAGEPAVYDVARGARAAGGDELRCWGSVTLMVGGRDLLHEDKYVRIGSVQYVKDTIDMMAGLGGEILTVVPSTVGKIVPMGSPEDEWGWAVESLKECQAHAEEQGRPARARAAEPLRDVLPQPARPGARARGGRGRQLRRLPRHLPHEHRGGRLGRRDPQRPATSSTTFHVADNNRMPCGQGAIDWASIVAHARGGRLRRLPHRGVRRHGRSQPHLDAHRDRRRVRGGRERGARAVPPRPRHRRRARRRSTTVRQGVDRRAAAAHRRTPDDAGLGRWSSARTTSPTWPRPTSRRTSRRRTS